MPYKPMINNQQAEENHSVHMYSLKLQLPTGLYQIVRCSNFLPLHFVTTIANMLRLYIDNNATTPVILQVVETMLLLHPTSWRNYHGQSYPQLRMAGEADAICHANGVALAVCRQGKKLFFTSGATEITTLPLKGVKCLCSQRQPYHYVPQNTKQCWMPANAENWVLPLHITLLNAEGLINTQQLEF